ncbi:MAG: paraquat-inducible protein A [Advenella sp.]|uniref:Paraquat-inducible membrane protein A n=1 Tax=Advenella kashmirensis TaxID=310575 RepID=A0A356LAA4_9BURK|nr:paraquat-inducible protein A [Advenella sp. FME57]HBP27854.1 paraquat-inducible membrane protein A [Advenella kashmirensis]
MTGNYIACHHCGQLHERSALVSGQRASCVRCGTVLWSQGVLNSSAWLAIVLTALIAFIIASFMPVGTISAVGLKSSSTFLEAVAATWRAGYPSVAIMCFATGFLMPLLDVLILTWLLAFSRKGRRAPGLNQLSRWLHLVRPWAMVPVFMLGALVAIVKLADMASLTPGAGLWAYAALTFLLTGLSKLTSERVWLLAEQDGAVKNIPVTIDQQQLPLDCEVCGQITMSTEPEASCQRCHNHVHFRKPAHKTRTLAILLTAIILYFPANLYPVMINTTVLGGTASHTILGGILELWNLGSWDLALIVFVASFVVPLTKIVILGILIGRSAQGRRDTMMRYTRMYQTVELIGQWSMLDVFVVILLTSLVNFGSLMSVRPDVGAAAFGMVVVVTMFATMNFDIRKGWDQVDDNIEQPDYQPAPTAPTFS